MAVGEVRAECADRVRARADVVVDDVEHDAETFPVRRVDKTRKAAWAAVGGMGRRRIDAVVAPTALARERGNRHQLDRGHAKLA